MTIGWRQAIINGVPASRIRDILTRDGARRTNFYIAEHADGDHSHLHVLYYESSGKRERIHDMIMYTFFLNRLLRARTTSPSIRS